jgi:hypothetical protein
VLFRSAVVKIVEESTRNDPTFQKRVVAAVLLGALRTLVLAPANLDAIWSGTLRPARVGARVTAVSETAIGGSVDTARHEGAATSDDRSGPYQR